MNDPVALALSGSNPAGAAAFSCCLRRSDQLFAAASPADARGDLAELASTLCGEHGVRPADLAELRVDLGPGSYTGLRVAITFARFLQHFADLPVLACDSLLLLADSAAADLPEGARLRPLLDARRDRVHCSTVQKTGGLLHNLVEPAAVPFADFAASIHDGDHVVTTAAMAARFGAALRARGATVHAAASVSAAGLFSPRLPLRPCRSAELEPRYLMGSYADET